MKKVTMETNFNEIKAAAKELGINFVGKKKEVLVNEINAGIDAKTAPKEVKTLADYNLTENEVVNVVGRSTSDGKQILTGRTAQVIRASKIEGFVKAHLFNTKGELQKTEIALPVEAIQKQGVNEAA